MKKNISVVIKIKSIEKLYAFLIISGMILISFFSCKTKKEIEEKIPSPVAFSQINIKGELYQRAMKNFDRLETDIYHPENIFPKKHHPSSVGWPGDKEGRTMLGLVMESQATHRTPKYLDEMIRIFPEKVNIQGYLGAVQGDTIIEQQLAGHGWLLRSLCEYYIWKKDPKVKTYIDRIIKNLVLPTTGYHKNYPIDPEERIKNVGEMAGSSVNIINNWKLSTDIGCDLIFMDGVVQAYSLFPSDSLKKLIDEIVSRFFEMDLVKIKAQTHATLTGLRAVLRYYDITGEKYLLEGAEKRYNLYLNQAITENYENFNWFGRPEWTEPCAIIDSYMVAVQLWQHTQLLQYLEYAQLIYYNAICHTQRSNGGFGTDNCPGPVDKFLSVVCNEAWWCCTMRGGEGLSRAIQYSYFTKGDTLFIPGFYESSLSFNLNGNPVSVEQKTNYPFGSNVRLTVHHKSKACFMNFQFFVPSWFRNPKVFVNENPVSFNKKNGFIHLSDFFKDGDVIDYSFDMESGIESIANSMFTDSSLVRLHYGPLLLGSEGEKEIKIPKKVVIVKQDKSHFFIKGTGINLSPVYHLMDAHVCQDSVYRKQILFKKSQ
ncbi:MAG: glycoside hydrolase family 127 protein [Prolixibacteraceae bacterium]|nr:glycoside hydrolase family 127 protein [Prolixibacteraceae bacterium]